MILADKPIRVYRLKDMLFFKNKPGKCLEGDKMTFLKNCRLNELTL